MSNNGVCKKCGEEHPLLRSGMCSSCMRSLPVRGNIASSRGVDEYKIAEKLDTIIARVDVVYDKVDAIEGETSAFRELSIEAVEDEMVEDKIVEDLKGDAEDDTEESGPVGSSFYLVAAIVVCVVVGFLFRDKVLNFISGLKGQDTSGYIS